MMETPIAMVKKTVTITSVIVIVMARGKIAAILMLRWMLLTMAMGLTAITLVMLNVI